MIVVGKIWSFNSTIARIVPSKGCTKSVEAAAEPSIFSKPLNQARYATTVDIMASQPRPSHAVTLNGCQPLYKTSPPAMGIQTRALPTIAADVINKGGCFTSNDFPRTV